MDRTSTKNHNIFLLVISDRCHKQKPGATELSPTATDEATFTHMNVALGGSSSNSIFLHISSA